MICEFTHLKYAVLLFIFFQLGTNSSYPQTFSKIGLKAGVLVCGISSYNDYGPTTYYNQHSYINDTSSFFSFANFDIGFTIEWFNTKRFCLSTEFHYIVKGSSDKIQYTVPNYVLDPGGNHWEFGYLNDKIQYLSLVFLPRYRIAIAPSLGGNVYLFGGPALGFMLKDQGSYTKPEYIEMNNFLNNFSGVFGIGFEWEDLLSFELRGEHDFTGPYNFTYKNESIARRYTTITFLLGVSFYKHKSKF